MKKILLLLISLISILSACKKSQQEDLTREVRYRLLESEYDSCKVVFLVNGKLDSIVIKTNVNKMSKSQLDEQKTKYLANTKNQWLYYDGSFRYLFTAKKGDSVFVSSYVYPDGGRMSWTEIGVLSSGASSQRVYNNTKDYINNLKNIGSSHTFSSGSLK